MDEWQEKTFEGGIITVLQSLIQQQNTLTPSVLFSDRQGPKIHELSPDDSLGATGLGTLCFM